MDQENLALGGEKPGQAAGAPVPDDPADGPAVDMEFNLLHAPSCRRISSKDKYKHFPVERENFAIP